MPMTCLQAFSAHSHLSSQRGRGQRFVSPGKGTGGRGGFALGSFLASLGFASFSKALLLPTAFGSFGASASEDGSFRIGSEVLLGDVLSPPSPGAALLASAASRFQALLPVRNQKLIANLSNLSKPMNTLPSLFPPPHRCGRDRREAAARCSGVLEGVCSLSTPRWGNGLQEVWRKDPAHLESPDHAPGFIHDSLVTPVLVSGRRRKRKRGGVASCCGMAFVGASLQSFDPSLLPSCLPPFQALQRLRFDFLSDDALRGLMELADGCGSGDVHLKRTGGPRAEEPTSRAVPRSGASDLVLCWPPGASVPRCLGAVLALERRGVLLFSPPEVTPPTQRQLLRRTLHQSGTVVLNYNSTLHRMRSLAPFGTMSPPPGVERELQDADNALATLLAKLGEGLEEFTLRVDVETERRPFLLGQLHGRLGALPSLWRGREALKVLDLNWNAFDDDGVRCLADCCPGLEVLVLDRAEWWTDAAVRHVVESLPSLRHFRLRSSAMLS
ncbi:unnamed protein product, partial [Polarella glacialis]